MAPRIRDRKRNCAVVSCGLGAPRPLVEDREILAENIPIYAALYTLICYLRRRGPLVRGTGLHLPKDRHLLTSFCLA